MNNGFIRLRQSAYGGLRTQGGTRRSAPDEPLITVITVVFNGAETVEHAIKSVIGQKLHNVEYIVVDGGSTDGTQEIIEKYADNINYWVSEKDAGIYDAMNKGVGLATGDVVGFLNADDFYASPDALETVAHVFRHHQTDACYGDLCYVRSANTRSVVRYWRSSDFQPGSFAKAWCPPHPTFYVRRKILERFGGFDLNYRIAADIELMMRLLEVHRIHVQYIHKVLVRMRMGGTTNRSFRNIVKQNVEITRALRSHGLTANLVSFVGNKLLSRGRQFVFRPSKVGTNE